jgi:hypothetical protein
MVVTRWILMVIFFVEEVATEASLRGNSVL